MASYRCLIVDDEPIAGEIIASFVERLGDFEIAGICQSSVVAFEQLQRERIDLLFLDIQMPRLTGLELLRTLPSRPMVVLTTAYREFAIEGYELDVVDYLLKPIAFERFLQAIAKFHARLARQPAPASFSPVSPPVSPPAGHLFVRAERKMMRVLFNDILFLESLKDYVRIFTPSESIVTKEQLAAIEERLPAGQFLRIHRSYIVNKDHITAYTAHDVEIGKREIPVGRKYKLDFERAMKGA